MTSDKVEAMLNETIDDILAGGEGAEEAVGPEGEAVSEAIGRAVVDGRISCRAAFRISAKPAIRERSTCDQAH